MSSKTKAAGRAASSQQAAFELKHRVALALTKLADRDTQQIGADELERIAGSLPPHAIATFVSCVADTDADQKTGVRKECIRILATLARAHGTLLGPHLSRMAGSIVKRLKDTDSVVRDACVETAGALAAASVGGSAGGAAAFVALARPLFEALGEQNKYVQAGAALCLARVIDETSEPPPPSLLPQMLTRVLKLLKNPHFMARPAVIELIRSIIQAGGASTENTLSAAITGILEALKSNDWTTRKAASVALANIACSAGSLMGSFKSTCIRALESCRFDKVKPVRDAVMHAIQCWKTLPGSDSPEPSEAGSSTKENFGGDYVDVTSASDGGWKDTSFRKVGPSVVPSGNSTSLTKKRHPLTSRKTCPNYVQNHQNAKSNDWNIEISLPEAHAVSLVETYQKESEGTYIGKTFERQAEEKSKEQYTKYHYDIMVDKPECSSVSDLVSGSFETKHVTVARRCQEEADSEDLIRINHRPARGESDREGPRFQDRNSLDSTVTDISSRAMHDCCLHAANELSFLRKQLLQIETKQSNILDILQVFMGNSMDSLSALQMKVHKLEDAVDKIAEAVASSECSTFSSKHLKRNQSVSSSPRLSTCTPRPSVDSNYRNPSLLSTRSKEMWMENTSSKSRSSTSTKECVDLWRDPTLNIIRNPIAKGMQKNSEKPTQGLRNRQTRDVKDMISISSCNATDKVIELETRAGFWKRIKGFLCAGDLESAYAEVLSSDDDLSLIQLMDRTGPVLERLSHETANEILSTMATHFVNQRFMDSLIPWLQQVVDLSNSHEAMHHFRSMKAQPDFLSAVQEAAGLKFHDPVDSISMSQLASKLAQAWNESSCRKMPPSIGPQRKYMASTTRE